jgi:hypothetical protein
MRCAMRKSVYLILAFVLIGFLAIGDAFARGFRGGGARSGHRGGSAYRGGGATHRSPSMGHRSSGQRSRQPSRTHQVKRQPSARPQKASRPPQRTASRKPTAARPKKSGRPSQAPTSRAPGRSHASPSRSQVQDFLGMPSSRPSSGTRDLAKVGTGAVVGALGAEGARQLIESGKGRPSQRPAGPERPGRPEQPIAGRPGGPDKPGKPSRPPRPDQPIAKLPDRPGKPGGPDRPVRPEHPIAKPPHKPGHPRPPATRPPHRPGRPPYPSHPIYGPGHGIRPQWWRHAAWGAAAGWIVGASFSSPQYYDYDDGIYYQDEYVYVDGKKTASAEEYYDQASELAASASAPPETSEKDLLPLGVFSLSQGQTDESNMALQLAVSKDGVISGTYYNTSTNTERPIKGMVDKKTQRAAWTFADGKNTDVIMETGLYNLTKDETEALVHFGKDKTQKVRLVRLKEPDSKESPQAQAKPTK